MSDILKYGNPIRLARLASDPAGADEGTTYYNTSINAVKTYVNGAWAIDMVATAALTASRALVSDSSGNISSSSVTSTELGYVSGVTSAIQTQLGNKISSSEKGANNGVATLDGGGKVPASQLPNSLMDYLGTWAASTNTPTLANGSGNAGDVYVASDAGTVNFGAGNITFAAGDWVIYSGSIWEKSINSNAVVSVNSQTGVVSLDTDDIAEATALYFTDERAQDAIGSMVANSSKVSLTYVDGTPSLTADIVADSLVNADINSSAAIALSKLAAVTASRALASDASGFVSATSVTSTELGYLSGVTSAIQTQLDNKASTTLNNLGTTSINANLLPDSAAGRSVGSSTLPFSQVHTRQVINAETVVTFTADTTSGSAVLTNVSSITGLNTNQEVVGSGIPSQSLIASIDSATQITLENNATATATGVTFRAVSTMDIRTSNHSSSDPSGYVTLKTGNTANSKSGDLNLSSGRASGSGDSGNVLISTGTSGSGTRGSVSITANGINLNGTGSVISQLDILPASTNTLDLGSSSAKFAEAHIGSKIVVSDHANASGSVSIKANSGSATYDLILPAALPGSTQAVTITSAGQLGTSAFAAASAGDISETSFTGLADNTANQTVTGFLFNNATVRSFQALVSVYINATSDLYANYELRGIQRGSDWALVQSYNGDDITGFAFNITTGGQIQASIGSITGFSDAVINFRAITTSI